MSGMGAITHVSADLALLASPGAWPRWGPERELVESMSSPARRPLVGVVSVALALASTAACNSTSNATATHPASATAVSSSAPSTAPAAQHGGQGGSACSLLTPAMAAAALGKPVGAPVTERATARDTCAYGPARYEPNLAVSLTIGSAATVAMDRTPSTGKHAVSGVGDSAEISYVIGDITVVKGGQTYGVLVLRDPKLSEATLIAFARKVLAPVL